MSQLPVTSKPTWKMMILSMCGKTFNINSFHKSKCEQTTEGWLLLTITIDFQLLVKQWVMCMNVNAVFCWSSSVYYLLFSDWIAEESDGTVMYRKPNRNILQNTPTECDMKAEITRERYSAAGFTAQTRFPLNFIFTTAFTQVWIIHGDQTPV